MVEVAEYVNSNSIVDTPDWWGSSCHYAKTRLTKSSKTRISCSRYKFGIIIPQNLKTALDLDKENYNTLWVDSIKKDMANLVFEILELDEMVPITYKKVPW